MKCVACDKCGKLIDRAEDTLAVSVRPHLPARQGNYGDKYDLCRECAAEFKKFFGVDYDDIIM